jgi:hypothetical protein
LRTLYLGIILYNPSQEPVTVDILQTASYLSQPDAPFIELPSVVDNPAGTVYAGPGSRVMSDILRGVTKPIFLPKVGDSTSAKPNVAESTDSRSDVGTAD